MSVLGDTSYGDCCVDCVAAEHVGSDGIIHFGNTCFAPTEKLPVLYVFTRLSNIKLEDIINQINKKFNENNKPKNSAIFYDVPYHHIFTTFPSTEDMKNIYICRPPFEKYGVSTGIDNGNIISDNDIPENDCIQCGRLIPNTLFETINAQSNDSEDTLSEWNIVYVGHSDIYSQYLALTFPRAHHYLYLPDKKIFVEANSNVTKALMRRYYSIEKTKDAERIGILVGTLGVVKYCDIIEKCRDTIKRAGKRQYTFLVGKPNSAKLANFPEIDVFVVVACPLNSIELVIGNISKGRDRTGTEFLRPIITPYELDVALNPKQEWNGGSFRAKYQTILPGEEDYVQPIEEMTRESEENFSDVSLITGKLRSSNFNGSDCQNVLENENETSIATQERQISVIHEGGGGQFLKDRSWQGLEQKLGNIPASMAVKGQTGIATHYKPIVDDT